jgi:tRNA-dihydrouridine synthase B
MLLIKPLIISNQTFSTNLIQGPLAGVSCAPFRGLVWKYSQPAFTCTEMISCKTLLYSPQFAYQRFVAKHPNEGPVCFQLSADNPKELALATQKATDLGANLIDLNCGCPVKKIRLKGAGSKLLADASKLYQLANALKQNTSVPVSIKIRVDGASDDRFNQEIVKVVNDSGIDFLVVHGRHWTEQYETPCRYEEIQFFVEQVKVPVIGNGDISCVDSLKKMLSTGCAGVMIARAGMGQPWLIAKLIAEMNQQKFLTPTSQEIGAIFIEHIEQLIALLGQEKFAIFQARKFAKYYARHLEKKKEFCEAMNGCFSFSDLKILCGDYFKENKNVTF